MRLTVKPVDINYVAQTWPMVEPYLKSALATAEGPESEWCYNIHHVQSFITSGQWTLFVFLDEQKNIKGALTVSFINYPMQRIAFISLLGGHLVINKDTVAQIKNWCRIYGATKIQAYATGPRVRLWRRCDLKPCATVMGLTL